MKERYTTPSGFNRISPLPKSFDGGAPKNKKRPTINDINWRALNSNECERLFYATAKGQVLKTIIDKRQESMLPTEYDGWRLFLCDYM